MSIHRTPAQACPACGYRLDAHTARDGDAAPRPGDLSLCLRCGAVLEFGPTLRVRALTDAEVDALPPDEHDEVMRTAATILRYRGAGGEP